MADILPTQTITYKSVNGLDIALDVYLPSNANRVPVLLWFHGGGLLQGHRNQLAPHMRRAVQQQNLCVLSADYRLAPQTRLPEIFQDVKDCVHFVRHTLTSQVDEGTHAIDPSRLAISGSSAGGYLALLAGLYCDPKPACLVPIYPITDPLGAFFTTSQPAPMGRYLASRDELAMCLDPGTEVVANCGPLGQDARMWQYVRMLVDANLAKLLGVADPETAAPWRVSRNVFDRGLPAMYVVHGDEDGAVGVEQADEVVGAQLGCGGEVVYERVHGKNHFLDVAPEYENGRMYEWLMGHLGSMG